MRNTTKVILGQTAKSSVHNQEKLQKQAEALASKLLVPADVEFARFEHNGKQFALSARLIIEVEALDSRVPDVVIRKGDSKPASKRRM